MQRDDSTEALRDKARCGGVRMLNIAIHREPLHESEKKPQVQSETTVLREALKLKQDISMVTVSRALKWYLYNTL